MTEGTSTTVAPTTTEAAGPVAAVATSTAATAAAPVAVEAQVAAMAAVAAAAPAARVEKPAAPAVGPAAVALAALEAAAAAEAAAAKKEAAADAKKDSKDSDETSMSDADVLAEVELATLGEAGAAAAGQAGLPCGVLPAVDAPVEVAPPVEVPVGDSGFALSPALLGLLGLGALGIGYLLLRDKDDDDSDEDENSAPVAANDVAAVNENATATGSVATNDSDPDGDTLTYTVSGTAPAGFTLNTNGSFTFDAANAAYPELAAGVTQNVTVNYIVTDPDGATDTATLTITITGVNAAPTITSGATATVAENAPATTVVYDANATDPEGGTITYSLSGADAALLTINPATGEVRLVNPADFEADSSYSFNVVATDPANATATQAVTLTVTNVNEAPTITSGGTANVNENVPAGTQVYDANATDPEGATLTYSLGGADAAAFTINATTGVVTINASPDFETRSSYNITVTASDGTASSTQAVVVTVNDLVEGPTIVSLDQDNDANFGTAYTIVPSAATDDFLYRDDDDTANNVVIVGFGADDVIQFEAPATGVGSVSYSNVNTGDGDGLDDLLITINNGGVISQITLEDVVNTAVQPIVFDEASAENAVAGTNNFQAGVVFAAPAPVETVEFA